MANTLPEFDPERHQMAMAEGGPIPFDDMERAILAAMGRVAKLLEPTDLHGRFASEYLLNARNEVTRARGAAQTQDLVAPGTGATGITYGSLHIDAAGPIRQAYGNPETNYRPIEERWAMLGINLGSATLLDAIEHPGQPETAEPPETPEQ